MLPGAWGTFLATCTALLSLPFSVVIARATTVTVPGDFPTIQAVVDSIQTARWFIDTVMVRTHSEPSPLYIQWCDLTVIGVPDQSGALPTLPRTFVVEGTFNLRNLHILGPIAHWGETEFRGCEIDSGVTSVGAGNRPSNLRVVDCTIRGQRALDLIHYVAVDSCRVFGRIIVDYENDAGLTMHHSTMTGPGSHAIALRTSAGCRVEDNVIRGFDNGVSAAIGDGNLIVRNNLIDGCPGVALHAHSPSSGSAEFSGNRVIDCGLGVDVGSGFIDVKDNVILGSALDGIRFGGESGTIAHNVVGRSGGHGIVVTSNTDYDVIVVQNNTSFANGGSGFALHLNVPTRVERNISYGNHGYGLVIGTGSWLPALSCNDWFNNDSGAVAGMAPSSDDLAIDPHFCDVANDDVHLAANSQLLDYPGCGLIGASGLGCDVPTPTLLSLVSAHVARDRVELAWSDPSGDISSATVYRRTVRDNWQPVGEIRADGSGQLVYEDGTVIAGTRYGYRLGVMESGQQVFLGETWVDVPLASELALVGFKSNPVRDDRSVVFTLVDASPARLEMFDVGGRKIAAREVGTLGGGSHVVTLGDGRTLTSGVYLLRLTQGARSIMARAVILR